jgi:hypothetical protein
MENLNSINPLSDECQEYLKRIEACIDSPHTNTWEDDFLEDMRVQVLSNRPLFGGQVDKFEQVEHTAIHGRDNDW